VLHEPGAPQTLSFLLQKDDCLANVLNTRSPQGPQRIILDVRVDLISYYYGNPVPSSNFLQLGELDS
jgi:hypothetical protein